MGSHLTELAARQAAELDGDLSNAAEQVARTLALFGRVMPALSADRSEAVAPGQLARQSGGLRDVRGIRAGTRLRPDVDWFAPYYCREPTRQGLRFVDIADARARLHATWTGIARPRTTGRPSGPSPTSTRASATRFMCTYSAPILADGKFRGVVTVDVLSERPLREISRVKIGGGYCVLVSRKGTLHLPSRSVAGHARVHLRPGRAHGVDELADVGQQMIAGRRACAGSATTARASRSGSSLRRSNRPDWSLAAVIPESEVMTPIHALAARSSRSCVAGLAVILGIVWLMSARVTRPITRLAAAAERSGTRRPRHARLGRRGQRRGRPARQHVQRDGRRAEDQHRGPHSRRSGAARRWKANSVPRGRSRRRSCPACCRRLRAAGVRPCTPSTWPAKTVAGDFFDFFFLDDHRLALVMADVSGKGIPAAIYMAVTRTKLRDFAAPDRTPAQVVAEVNRSLADENDSGMFVTLFFGYYDTRDGELVYVNAGHNPPYVVRRDGRAGAFDPTGPLVAPFPRLRNSTTPAAGWSPTTWLFSSPMA